MPPSPSWVIRGMKAFGVLQRTGQIGGGDSTEGALKGLTLHMEENARGNTHIVVSRPSTVPGLGLYPGGIPSLPRIFLLNNVLSAS